MELKYIILLIIIVGKRCSNRTFMELKYAKNSDLQNQYEF